MRRQYGGNRDLLRPKKILAEQSHYLQQLLIKRAAETPIQVVETHRKSSSPPDDDTTVNILIGSKNFAETWNSWHVPTMGLLNIELSEGSEIIPLFGRGVRLKGYEFGLKRKRPLESVCPPAHLETLKTPKSSLESSLRI